MSKKKLKFYFTASIAQKEKYIKNYKKIVEIVKKEGHDIVADHILNVSEREVDHASREDRLKFHQKLEKWIYSSDALIADTSFPSIGVGYEISLALRVGKPILVLYSEATPPSLLAHHSSEKIICEKYTLQRLPSIIEDFINYVNSKADLRFTFFITPKIASYLDKITKKDKIPKSVYLRKLIEKDIQNNS